MVGVRLICIGFRCMDLLPHQRLEASAQRSRSYCALKSDARPRIDQNYERRRDE